MNPKRVEESYTEQVQVLGLANMNGNDRLFGGTLMSWIDIVAAVVARRHSNRNVTTASVSELTFKAPAFANDTLLLCGHITYAGRTSMEICVESYVEELNGARNLINTAYLTMVALDENGLPCQVPPLLIETEKQKREFEAALERRKKRNR
ncbi:MAG: acyl-CoA thioesterase [Clostridia bacterium]|jgi:acyl-CoA hydrolase|nr:acyl-CoA thioesterase [Clostridia bacterium]MBO7397583.1 acyl-CoA thioesterase [Clostridia bacterium]MBO7503501.1 acyl-CoA thioesterase [Clostridia bacterium]MBO7658439.1 acyl-CoA thioesterase [Clostridia bacterium]MBP5666379.1 acyl-CoA thioesterase [Clostridia bacterium]